jgi:hypothetical protein
MLLFSCIFVAACGPGELTSEELSAIAFCHVHIKDQLRSPATARFTDNYREAVSAQGDAEYLIKSWVESKNVFDTRIQHDYVCRVRKEGEGWQLVKLDIDWDTDWVVE